MYYFYLSNTLLPVSPSKLKLKIKNQNKTLNLINEGEINILKKAGLTEVSFEILLPNVKYPFAIYKNGFVNAKTYLDIIEKLKVEQKPFQFIVSRKTPSGNVLYDTNMKVSLEDYEISEDADNGIDVNVSIKLKQYRDFGTKTCEIKMEQKKVSTTPVRETTNSPAPVQDKLYTVVKGDCLWNIAKKFYGNGKQYTKIYNANKDQIKNPSLIYPKQVLKIPA